MTHSPVRLTSVLFGFVLTVIVAVTPLVALLIPQASSDAATSVSASTNLNAMGFPDATSVLLLLLAALPAAGLAILIARYKAERSRW